MDSRLTAQGRRAGSEIMEAPKRHEGRAIADAAATMGADLIVMGSRGRSRLAGIVLGSVTASVITMLPAPSLWPGSSAPRPSLATNASSGLQPPADAGTAPEEPSSILSGAR